MSTFHTFLRRFRSSHFYIIFVAVFFVNSLLSTFFSIGILGSWNFYTNVSTSMEPTIQRGDLAIVLRKDMNSYKLGDIVTFHEKIEGTDQIITHRIHAIGGNVYITKGDNNTYPDAQVLRPRLIVGKVVAIIPNMGYWVMFLKNILGRIFFIVLPMLLIVLTEFSELLQNRNSKR